MSDERLSRHLKSKAVFGEVAGWERANWFSNNGQSDEYRYSWKRQNWFENSAREHMAVRENVGLYDMSTFGKIRVEVKMPKVSKLFMRCKLICRHR